MLWVPVAIASYLLLALVALVDKYLLAGPLPSAKFYAFSVGALGAAAGLFLLPFGFVSAPSPGILGVALAAGALRVAALFSFFAALRRFEASRVVPAIGAMVPVITLVLTTAFGASGELDATALLAFAALVAGGVGVSVERQRTLTLTSLGLSLASSSLFSLSFLFSKLVYDEEPFFSGFFWTLVGGGAAALLLLLFSETRREVQAQLHPKPSVRKPGSAKVMALFVSNQGLGGAALVLQNWAFALAPLGYLAFVNALEGTKFVFLFLFVVFFSRRFPHIISEELSLAAVFQKAAFILVVVLGLLLLAV